MGDTKWYPIQVVNINPKRNRMIEFTIEIPHEVLWVQTPKMILGNYINTDSRVRRIECDRLMGYCETEVEIHDNPLQQISYYLIRAIYKDPEAEMITRLIL